MSYVNSVQTIEEIDTLEDVLLEDVDNAELYAHWVDAEKAQISIATGRSVVALCGKVWTPKHNPDDYPVCPTCQKIYEDIISTK